MKPMALLRRTMKEFVTVGAASLARDVFHDRLNTRARQDHSGNRLRALPCDISGNRFSRRTVARLRRGRARRSRPGAAWRGLATNSARHPGSAYYLGIPGANVAYLIIPFAKSAGTACCKAVSICDSTKNSKFNNLLTAQIRVGTRLDSHLLRRMRASARVTFVMTSPDQLRSGDQAGIEP